MSKFAQSFDYIAKDYKLGDNGLLVEIGEIDEFEKIQENKNCALDVVLDKFLVPIPDDQSILDDSINYFDLSGQRDDLLNQAEFKNRLAEYRQVFGLPDDSSDLIVINELERRVKSNRSNLEKQIDIFNKKELENEKNEIKEKNE